MAGPRDETAAGRGHLRASHADRDRMAGTLKTAFVQGMLDQGEFTLRVGQALAARTYADLAALTADLPAGLRADPPPWPWPARARRQPSGLRPRRWIAIATVLYAAVWAYVLLAPDRGGYPAAPMLVIGGFCAYLSVCVIGLGEMALDRQFRRSAIAPGPSAHGAGEVVTRHAIRAAGRSVRPRVQFAAESDRAAPSVSLPLDSLGLDRRLELPILPGRKGAH